ncbi:MAG: hypothetical protein ACJ76X_17630 [Solirubrobacteraceae bacterium]|jgi:hypothetical protein
MRSSRKHAAGAGRGDWVAWRSERLLSAGFAPAVAERLAHQPEVDVHALLELVDRGCPPQLAARILAPLERSR